MSHPKARWSVSRSPIRIKATESSRRCPPVARSRIPSRKPSGREDSACASIDIRSHGSSIAKNRVLFQDESITRSQEIDMAYMLLVMEGPGDREARTESELRASYDRMLAFSAELKSRGLLTLSQALSRPSNAARVSMQGDRALVRDGPFAEAREVV